MPPTLGASATRLGLAVVAALAYLVGVPLLLADQPYWLNVPTNASMLSFASLGVWVTFAIGRINIAQGAFCMIGGYTTAILATRYGVPFWLCLPLSGLVAAAVGTAIGIPILRLRGVYFAMITLSLTEARAARLPERRRRHEGRDRHRQHPAARRHLTPAPSPFYVLAAPPPPRPPRPSARLATSRLGLVFRLATPRTRSWPPPSASTSLATASSPLRPSPCAMGGIAGGFFAVAQQNIYPATYTVPGLGQLHALTASWAASTLVLGPVVRRLPAQHLVRAPGFPPSSTRRCSPGGLMVAVMLFLPNGILSLTFSPAARRAER